MSLVDGNNDMVMPVAPMYGGGYNNGLFGNGDGAWWILILLFALGGWNGNGMNGGNGVLPYMWNAQTNNDVNRGFADAGLANQISNLSNAVNSGFASTEVSACNRTMDLMNQRFADTLTLTNNLNSINSSLQQCCCDNRQAISDLRYTVATEACADRAAVNDALRDVLTANTASTQRILDQMCQDKIDAKNERIADLERQLTMANLAASQGAQTAQILADNAAQTTALEQYLNPTPIPAYVVQNPNCCGNNYGCGCNSNF